MYSRTRYSINLPHLAAALFLMLERLCKKRQKLDNNEAGRHKERFLGGTRRRHRIAFGQSEGKRAVFSQVLSALARACLVAAVVALPALILPSVAADTEQIVLIVAVLAAFLTFMEYYGRYPSIVAFRFAPPYNRLKFGAVMLSVVALSLIIRGKTDPGAMTSMLTHLAAWLGAALDFPWSPVRLVLLMMPPRTEAGQIAEMRMAAGVCYAVSLAMVLIFALLVRVANWPMQKRVFNVWVNLPLFDPTSGGDVVERLRREAGVNILLGILLPFFVPAAVKSFLDLNGTVSVITPHTLIWMLTAWAILPASLLIRGIALYRVAGLITAKRRRVYGKDRAEGALGEA